jgi:hypothetical protein
MNTTARAARPPQKLLEAVDRGEARLGPPAATEAEGSGVSALSVSGVIVRKSKRSGAESGC